MKLYYSTYENTLILYDSTLKVLFKIPCKYGDSILLLVEEYFRANNIEIRFTELLAI
jgi:hypothetical protein